MSQRIPLMIVPTHLSEKWAMKFRGVGKKLSEFFPHVETDLIMTDIEHSKEEYLAMAFINAIFMGVIFGGLMSFLSWVKEKPVIQALVLGFAIGFGIFIMFLMLLSRYPTILAQNKAEMIDKDLVFALKDLSLQISAGVSLYFAFASIASSNYKEVSKEFKKVVQSVNSGTALADALESMALHTKSEYLKRTSWQIINTLKSGSNLKKTLKRIITDLSSEQRSKIKNYARELNLWSLIYMLFAVAIPSIGSTMLVILSSFAGFGISKGLFIMFIVICFIIQYILIGFVKARRPVANI